MDTPWTSFRAVDKGREYIALLSYLPLKSYSKIPLFMRFTFQIQRQLKESPGAVGYSLRAKLLRREFWTLSVWDNTQALMAFVGKLPHGEVMKALTPHMSKTKFTQWKISGSAVPPSWDDAARRGSLES